MIKAEIELYHPTGVRVLLQTDVKDSLTGLNEIDGLINGAMKKGWKAGPNRVFAPEPAPPNKPATPGGQTAGQKQGQQPAPKPATPPQNPPPQAGQNAGQTGYQRPDGTPVTKDDLNNLKPGDTIVPVAPDGPAKTDEDQAALTEWVAYMVDAHLNMTPEEFAGWMQVGEISNFTFAYNSKEKIRHWVTGLCLAQHKPILLYEVSTTERTVKGKDGKPFQQKQLIAHLGFCDVVIPTRKLFIDQELIGPDDWALLGTHNVNPPIFCVLGNDGQQLKIVGAFRVEEPANG